MNNSKQASTPHPPPPKSHQRITWAFALVYLLLIAYGSLYPLSGWDWHRGGLWILFQSFSLKHLSRSDIITNLVVYIPLGLMMALAWRHRFSTGMRFFAVTLCGILLSISMEYLQSYLPARVSSVVDTLFNACGTLLGALLAHTLATHTITGTHLHRLRQRLFLPGPLPNLGLVVLVLWALSQLSPLVPSLDRGTLVFGIRPLLDVLRGTTGFNVAEALTYALNIAALGLIASTLMRPGQKLLTVFGVFVCAVLLLKIPVVSRQLSLEAIIGACAALILLPLLSSLSRYSRSLSAGLMVLLAYSIEQLHTGTGPHAATLHAMNWIPFRDQMENLAGLVDIVETLWPFSLLSYLVLLTQARRPRFIAVGGALLVFAFTFVLEWLQIRVPGRFADMTDVCLAVLGWWLPWLIPMSHVALTETNTTTAITPPRLSRRTMALLSAFALAIVVLIAGLNMVFTPALESPLDEEKLPQLPAPEELARVSLPGFHYDHPRLPAPSAADIARLQKENPNFYFDAGRRARHGAGDFNAVTLMAYAQPGSQDLTLLHQRLMALKFDWRGHQQTKPVAVAYDWLYDQWSEEQRAQLRDKLAEGCNYQIHVIRTERLSPYNVYLYNSPFQALMACAIALYGDDPRGEPVMAFTNDYWKNRVLPVWRQIMGKNGGWHEGGEYVGIGIGQAIYELPAMWRKATGEDFFASEPGIRGFLDFLVYRTRPDGTHFRWGDAGYFDRIVPDQWALAMEYHHIAAYSLRRPPKNPTPSSWPWGPLTDASLYDPSAVNSLPLTAYFDGLGLIVARSDWTPDATYVTFKAGDNYWSHVHLDQGAFTIYKGGALAIDSGIYGTGYDSDHHMDYDYQTIAHNIVTVTDPDDTVPIPERDKHPERPIANDGGQRRVGSGWGIEAAPLDLSEWQQKREIYHTGKIESLLMDDGLSVAVADLTPAYTNSLSGKGTFSHRTRRVEQFHRVFGYDNVDDVVVIFDWITSTKAEFPKRWLLHTIEKPEISKDGFIVHIPPSSQTGHGGGRLEAHVLLPHKPYIQLMGGPGFEFFVDGKNYDKDVAEVAKRHKGKEPGAWRVEIMPDEPREKDEFLVVLLPTPLDRSPSHQIRFLEHGNDYGVEITGPKHTTRWWFNSPKRGVHIETSDPSGQRTHDLALPNGSAP